MRTHPRWIVVVIVVQVVLKYFEKLKKKNYVKNLIKSSLKIKSKNNSVLFVQLNVTIFHFACIKLVKKLSWSGEVSFYCRKLSVIWKKKEKKSMNSMTLWVFGRWANIFWKFERTCGNQGWWMLDNERFLVIIFIVFKTGWNFSLIWNTCTDDPFEFDRNF